MKRLTILRHAKSSWDQPEGGDFDRPLNDRGRSAAVRMGRELKQRGVRFDVVLASPATRVRETLDRLAKGYGEFDAEIRFEQSLYLADAATLLDQVKALRDDVEAPLLVGHNPGLQRLILLLAAEDDKARRKLVAEKYPTAALAVIELPAARWSAIKWRGGTLAELILPRELD
jgi:phosphohistidine phosphatase